jgi:hypothetical protein
MIMFAGSRRSVRKTFYPEIPFRAMNGIRKKEKQFTNKSDLPPRKSKPPDWLVLAILGLFSPNQLNST